MNGCKKYESWMDDDPAAVLKAFLTTVEYQNSEKVWNYLSEENRKQLQNRADAVNALQNGTKQQIPADMLRFGHVISSTREYEKFEVKSQDEQTAVVAIILHDKSTILVEMKRENQRWTVDLPLSD